MECYFKQLNYNSSIIIQNQGRLQNKETYNNVDFVITQFVPIVILSITTLLYLTINTQNRITN